MESKAVFLEGSFYQNEDQMDSADKHHILQEQQHPCRYSLPWQGYIFAGIGLHCFSSSSWGKQAKPEKTLHCLHARTAAEAPAGQPGCRAGAFLTTFQNCAASLAGTAGLQTACTQVDGTAPPESPLWNWTKSGRSVSNYLGQNILLISGHSVT